MMTGFSSLDAIVRFVGYQWTKMRGEIEGEMSAVFPEDKIAIMPNEQMRGEGGNISFLDEFKTMASPLYDSFLFDISAKIVQRFEKSWEKELRLEHRFVQPLSTFVIVEKRRLEHPNNARVLSTSRK